MDPNQPPSVAFAFPPGFHQLAMALARASMSQVAFPTSTLPLLQNSVLLSNAQAFLGASSGTLGHAASSDSNSNGSSLDYIMNSPPSSVSPPSTSTGKRKRAQADSDSLSTTSFPTRNGRKRVRENLGEDLVCSNPNCGAKGNGVRWERKSEPAICHQCAVYERRNHMRRPKEHCERTERERTKQGAIRCSNLHCQTEMEGVRWARTRTDPMCQNCQDYANHHHGAQRPAEVIERTLGKRPYKPRPKKIYYTEWDRQAMLGSRSGSPEPDWDILDEDANGSNP